MLSAGNKLRRMFGSWKKAAEGTWWEVKSNNTEVSGSRDTYKAP